MFKIKRENIVLGVIAIFSLILGTISVNADYVAPTFSPPECPEETEGCNLPINVSPSSQTKAGTLSVTGGIVTPDVTTSKIKITGSTDYINLQLDNNRAIGWKTKDNKDASLITLGGDNNFYLKTGYGGGNLIILNGGGNSERFRVTDAGSVGIGTNNPQYKLHIVGNDTGNFRGISVQNTNTDPNAKAVFWISTGGGQPVGMGVTSPTWSSSATDSSKANDLYLINNNTGTNGTGGISFVTSPVGIGNSVVMRLSGDGKLGIGVTSPDDSLEVNGPVSIRNLKPSTKLDLNGDGSINQSDVDLVKNCAVGYSSPACTRAASLAAPFNTTDIMDVQYVINGATGSNPFPSLTTSGTILAGGDVCAGSKCLSQALTSTSQYSSGWTYDSANKNITKTDMTGNVGIGTLTPSVKLSLGIDTGAKKLAIYDGVNDFYGFGLRAGYLDFYTNDKNRMTIKGTNGYVGIGVTDPTATLDVNGPAKFLTIQLPKLSSGDVACVSSTDIGKVKMSVSGELNGAEMDICTYVSTGATTGVVWRRVMTGKTLGYGTDDTIYTRQASPTSGQKSVTATCDAGDVATGGGFNTGGVSTYVLASSPFNKNGWYCNFSTANTAFICYVQCTTIR